MSTSDASWLRRLLRAGLGVVLALAAIWLVLFAVLRQPSLGRDRPAEPLAPADPERLQQHVQHLTGRASPRDVDHPEALRLAADHVRSALRDAGVGTAVQEYSARGSVQRNVVGRVGPVGPPTVVVGAHYDAMGLFGPNPGADDNASGVAGLLELARILALHPPGSPVELVAYSTEEPPFFASDAMGSAVHARSLRSRGVELRAMLCLEMIGYFTERQPWPSPVYRSLYPGRGDFIGIVGRLEDRHLARRVKRAFRGATTMPAYSYTAPSWFPDLDASDHGSYWQQGYPAVMITDTAFLRNPHYHQPTDTPDTLDYERMARVVDGVANAVLRLAADPRTE